MRAATATVLFAALALPATASATTVAVRIEGASRTIFEGSVESGVRQVQASSDTSGPRTCDGTNNGANASPGVTATSVAADALALQGQDFDGRWYSGFGDYLISRFGTETSRSWGLYRNDEFSSVGGCQLQAASGDRVLWAAGSGSSGSGVLRIAVSGQNPYTVLATSVSGGPVAGATVYDADAAGNLASAGAVTDGGGRAVVTLGAGYHRLKVGRADYVRSARAVVCADPCGGAPSDVVVRTVPAVSQTGVKVSGARQSDVGYRRGLITLRWRVTNPGVGLRSWTIAADDLSTSAKAYRVRARGTTATSASLRLPGGRTYALRFTSIDRLLRPASASFGTVTVPIDDRSRAIQRGGRWNRIGASNAWAGTVLRGGAGARIRVKLVRGRPILLLRSHRGSALLRVTAGRTTRTVRVRAARTGAHQLVASFRRSRSGVVTVRVVRGSIDLDGVAVQP